MPKVPLRDRILALLESDDEEVQGDQDQQDEEVQRASESDQDVVLAHSPTAEEIQKMISAAVAEALSTSGSSTPDASDPEQTPAPQRAPRPAARTQRLTASQEIPDFKTMSRQETQDWYANTFKPDLMTGKQTIDWSDR